MWVADALEKSFRFTTWSDLEAGDVGALDTITKLVHLATRQKVGQDKVRVSKIGQDAVFLSNLGSILPSLWVDSTVISVFHSLLELNAPQMCFTTKLRPSHTMWTLRLDTGFYDLLTCTKHYSKGTVLSVGTFSEEIARRLTAKRDTGRLGRVLIPINLDNNHWISGCLNLETLRLRIFDSMQGQHPAVVRNILKWAGQALSLDSATIQTEYVAMPQQLDCNCGILVLLFLLREACNWSDFPDPVKGHLYQEAIARGLMTGRLPIGREHHVPTDGKTASSPPNDVAPDSALGVGSS
eukprot:1063259-Rhodomonas_salina.1